MTWTYKPRLSGALIAAAAIGLPGVGAHAATGALTGNVARWVATAARTGAARDDQRVSIVVHMAVKDTAALKQVVAAVSKPGSPQYGRYLDVATFRARFAPDATDVSAVQTLLSGAGMTNVKAGPGGMYVSAVATVAQLRRTFGISQDIYKLGTLTLRANKEAPTLPASLAGKVVFIEGLDDSTFLKHPMHHLATQGEPAAPRSTGGSQPAVTPPPTAANLPSPYCDTYFGDLRATLSTKPNPYPQTLPWIGCGYTPQQIQQAYGIDKVTLDGSGVVVAIVDAYASPTLQMDGQHYASNHNLPPLTKKNFSQIIPPGIYDVPDDPSVCGGEYGWWTEQSLDLAAVHGTASGASIIYVGAEDCGTSLTTAFDDLVYNNEANVITNSYSYSGDGIDPATSTAQDQVFMTAAAEGITVLFSSGDSGDLSQVTGIATGSYDSDSDYVTGVGGTSLLLRDSAGHKTEYGWGNYRDYLGDALVNSSTSITTSGLEKTTAFGYKFGAFAYYGGAGGGISLIEPQPSYQVGIVPTALATTLYDAAGYGVTLPQPQRVSPDVSMVADPYTGYLYGETFTVAGNSASDAGCTPDKLQTSQEYCEADVGGTSLASPLMAGVIAIVDQQRNRSGKPVVGFANPWLYANQIGTGLTSAGINDVTPPATATALLRGYVTDPTRIRLVTINSAPFLIDTTPYPLFVCGITICEGVNDVFNYTTPGYDDVTGLGVPYLPKLIKQ